MPPPLLVEEICYIFKDDAVSMIEIDLPSTPTRDVWAAGNTKFSKSLDTDKVLLDNVDSLDGKGINHYKVQWLVFDRASTLFYLFWHWRQNSRQIIFSRLHNGNLLPNTRQKPSQMYYLNLMYNVNILKPWCKPNVKRNLLERRCNLLKCMTA